MSIRASAYSCDITPGISMPLAGYPGRQRMSAGSRDPISASAIHIRGGSGGIIILALDLFFIDSSLAQRIRRKIFEATGTREKNVFIGTSGTFAAPVTACLAPPESNASTIQPDEEYLDYILERAVKAASETAGTSRPAAVATVDFDAPGTGALIVMNNTGRIFGIVMFTDQPPNCLGENNLEFSSDFIDPLRKKLAAKLGGSPVIACFSSGRGNSLQPQSDQSQNAEAVGEKLAEELIAKIKQLRPSDFMSDLKLGGKLALIDNLPIKETPDLMEAGQLLASAIKEHSAALASGSDTEQIERTRLAVENAQLSMSLISALQKGAFDVLIKDNSSAILQVLRVGPARLLALPAVVTSDYAAALVKTAGEKTWIAEAADGHLLGGILSCKAGQPESAEMLSVFFEPSAGTSIFKSATALLAQVC